LIHSSVTDEIPYFRHSSMLIFHVKLPQYSDVDAPICDDKTEGLGSVAFIATITCSCITLKHKESSNSRAIRLIRICHHRHQAAAPEPPDKDPLPSLVLVFLSGLHSEQPAARRVVWALMMGAAGTSDRRCRKRAGLDGVCMRRHAGKPWCPGRDCVCRAGKAADQSAGKRSERGHGCVR
jgi:hypothetical protein